MRVTRMHLWSAIALVAASLSVAATAAAQDRPRVAVIKFNNPSGVWGTELGSSARSQLVAALLKRKDFTVVDRQISEAILQELFDGKTGQIKPGTAPKVGELLGVEYFIVGELSSFDLQYRGLSVLGKGYREGRVTTSILVRVVSVATGEIILAPTSTKTVTTGREGCVTSSICAGETEKNSPFNPTVANKALPPVMEEIADALVAEKSSFTREAAAPAAAPSIVGSKEGMIYIDRGKGGGVVPGQKFNVMRVVDTIKDGSGKVLDVVTKQVGVIEVVQVLNNSSICKIVSGEATQTDKLEAVSGR